MDKKILLITNIPTPYRLPLWDEIEKIVDFNVFCIAEKEKNRNWNLENRKYVHFLKSYHLFFSKRDWALHFSIPFSLFFRLVKLSPDLLIITGYDSLQYWEALTYAAIFRKKKVFWNGSTLLSSRSKNKIITFIKKVFIQSFDAYYTYGTKATEYIKYFEKNKPIITGTNTVDTDFFKQNTTSNKPHKNIKSFLYVGQLIERKGLRNTILAFSKIKQKNWNFIIIGSGEQEKELKELVQNLNMQKHIRFEGYKQKKEIIDYYSNADVLIMPSYLEVWGLVLNEALASGLFCLASKYAGATFDLIIDGENGFVIDPINVNNIASKIEMTFEKKIDHNKIKKKFNVSPKQEAKKILYAIERTLEC